MQAVLWTPGQPLGNLTAERVKEIQGVYTGPLVAVLDDDGGVKIIQPMDPNTGEDWESEEDALAFAERYMTPLPDESDDDEEVIEEM
jgi:hypothetical protein